MKHRSLIFLAVATIVLLFVSNFFLPFLSGEWSWVASVAILASLLFYLAINIMTEWKKSFMAVIPIGLILLGIWTLVEGVPPQTRNAVGLMAFLLALFITFTDKYTKEKENK